MHDKMGRNGRRSPRGQLTFLTLKGVKGRHMADGLLLCNCRSLSCSPLFMVHRVKMDS